MELIKNQGKEEKKPVKEQVAEASRKAAENNHAFTQKERKAEPER